MHYFVTLWCFWVYFIKESFKQWMYLQKQSSQQDVTISYFQFISIAPVHIMLSQVTWDGLTRMDCLIIMFYCYEWVLCWLEGNFSTNMLLKRFFVLQHHLHICYALVDVYIFIYPFIYLFIFIYILIYLWINSYLFSCGSMSHSCCYSSWSPLGNMVFNENSPLFKQPHHCSYWSINARLEWRTNSCQFRWRTESQ